jgi:dTDP-4-dehydrorhamnose 3,5-epimerase
MKITTTPLRDLMLLEPTVHGDERGYFFESYKNDFFKNNNLNYEFIQDNQARSNRGVLRGLHFQTGIHAQAKLIRALQGEILDVAVDIRPDSPTFGQHYSVMLTAHNKLQLLVPRGFAHGYAVLSETAEVFYKVDNLYAPKFESGIIYNDNDLNIDWKLNENEIVVSNKDAVLSRLNEIKSF